MFKPSPYSCVRCSWIPLTCGSSAVLIGLLFPMADQVYGNEVEVRLGEGGRSV